MTGGTVVLTTVSRCVRIPMTAVLPVGTQFVEELLTVASSISVALGMLAPIAYHQEAEEHTTKMGKVSHAVTRSSQRREQLNSGIDMRFLLLHAR